VETTLLPLCIYCFGPFRAEWAGSAALAFSTDKARALLAYLAVESGRPHRREYLASLLWSDRPEEQALHNLRQTLTYLRKSLNDDTAALPVILAVRDTIQLNPAVEVWVDVLAFGRDLAAARRYFQRRGGGGLNVRYLRRALGHFQNPFLDQFYLSGSPLFDDWAALVREDCSRRAVEAFAWLAEYHERRGEYTLARQAADRILGLTPWDESAHAQIMRLLSVDGQWSAAQHQFALLRRALDEHLAVQPARETLDLFEQIRTAALRDGTIPPRFPLSRHNLPSAFAPFVGRTVELDELCEMVLDPGCRLATLFGPGGVGKTSLALELARQQVGVFPDGVFFVPLAAFEQADRIWSALAEVLGLPVSDRLDFHAQLLDYLRARRLLLIFDNFEHLLTGPESVSLLVDILHQAPGVMLLVTSRERLNLQEECIYPLEGLSYPKDARCPEHSPESFDALALFASRARQVQRSFSLTEHTLPAAVRICRLLEGLPLGIELAAAALFNGSCAEIADAIAHDLDFLTASASNIPPRHRSLRAAFDVSWNLLSSGEQHVFRRLSVFRGGFEAQAAWQVAGASPEILAALAGQSLLRRSVSPLAGDEWRFDLLEPTRQAAAEKLAADPADLIAARSAHASCFAGFLSEQQYVIQGPGQTAALAAIQLEFENVRLAWDWLVERRDSPRIEGSLDPLYHFFNIRSRFTEGIQYFQAALDSLENDPAAEWVCAMLASRLGALAYRARSNDLALQSLVRARAVFERLDQPAELAFCLVSLGGLYLRMKDFSAALACAGQSLEFYMCLGDLGGQAYAQYLLGLVRSRQGINREARPHLLASVDLARRTGDQRRLVAPLNVLGDIACSEGDYPAGEKFFLESLEIARSLNDRFNQAIVLNNLASVAHSSQNYVQEQGLLEESLSLCREIGDRDGEAVALNNLGECLLPRLIMPRPCLTRFRPSRSPVRSARNGL
jgi:predicted ATPase/DNA-binding SARP family transcriptional activator